MSQLKSWSAFLFLAACIVLMVYRMVVDRESEGPFISQHSESANHFFSDTTFLKNSDEPRHDDNQATSDVNVGDMENDFESKSHKINNANLSTKISHGAWAQSLSHQSYGDGAHDDGESQGDVDEASIADIWQPIDEEEDSKWKSYEDEYSTMEWKENKKALQQWRSELELYGVDSQRSFLVTWDSVEVNRVLPFYISAQHTYTVSEFFMSLIPKASPYTGKSLGRCAVIGNSGILRHSGCGKQIDAADYVFRCNVPPLAEYEDDVGLKTDLTTMNPSMFDSGSFGSLSISRQSDDPLHIVLEPYEGVILLPCFSHFFYLRKCIKAIKQYNYYPKNANMTFLHPDHFSNVWDYWKDRSMTNLPSTGFYIVNVAATLCDQVDLYGFWPFDKTGFSGTSEHVMYHYYAEGEWGPAHDKSGEFGQLFKLHTEGRLRMHLGKC